MVNKKRLDFKIINQNCHNCTKTKPEPFFHRIATSKNLNLTNDFAHQHISYLHLRKNMKEISSYDVGIKVLENWWKIAPLGFIRLRAKYLTFVGDVHKIRCSFRQPQLFQHALV